jgi:glutaredoxin
LTAESVGSYEAQLAEHLTATGGTMYGAYWCPHCADQKAMFKEAAELLPYVECAADGENAQPELCQQKGIQGYPTWEIEGQLYPGVKSLADLAELSGFSAPQ